MSDVQVALYAARHGTTVLNANNCFRGTANPPLDDKGFRDASTLAHYFTPIDIAGIYSSDKLRARQTAETIANRKGVEINYCPQLRALNVGNFSGKPKSKENTEALEYYIQNPDVPIPGGESVNEFRGRVQPLFNECIEIYEDTGVPPLLVAHSSIIHELGNMFNNNHHSSRVEPGGAAALYCQAGEFFAEPIFKPHKMSAGENHADTVS